MAEAKAGEYVKTRTVARVRVRRNARRRLAGARPLPAVRLVASEDCEEEEEEEEEEESRLGL